MVYTSYFARLNKLPANIFPIAISNTVPKGYTGARYLKLAPTGGMLWEFKSTNDVGRFTIRYEEDILSNLAIEDILAELSTLSGPNKDICLVCYEKSGSFCHRQLVREWLNQHDISCEEWEPTPTIDLISLLED